MSHTYHSIWIHAIWASKERKPLIYPSIEQKLYQYILGQFREQGCPVRIINGMPDHIHCLFLLNAKKSVAETIKHVKGGSSYYMNNNNLISEKFYWQTGYSAFSVSESMVDYVFHYIRNQKEHHQKGSTARAVGWEFEHDGFDDSLFKG